MRPLHSVSVVIGRTNGPRGTSIASNWSRSMSAPARYKVVELSTVTDESLENTINEWVRLGWTFDGIQFAMRESSKRPAMAFVLFTRSDHP